MLIGISVPAGLPDDFLARVTYKDRSTIFPCVASSSFDGIVYCTGSQIPLGSTITLEMLTGKGRTVLYEGEFVINAYALATVVVTRPTATIDAAAAATKRAVTRPTATIDAAAAATKRAVTPTPRIGYPNP
jgi:hypothetical protein